MRNVFFCFTLLFSIGSLSSIASAQTCSEWLQTKKQRCIPSKSGKKILKALNVLDAATDYKRDPNNSDAESIIISYRQDITKEDPSITWSIHALADLLYQLNEFGVETGMCEDLYSGRHNYGIYSTLVQFGHFGGSSLNDYFKHTLPARIKAMNERIQQDKKHQEAQGCRTQKSKFGDTYIALNEEHTSLDETSDHHPCETPNQPHREVSHQLHCKTSASLDEASE